MHCYSSMWAETSGSATADRLETTFVNQIRAYASLQLAVPGRPTVSFRVTLSKRMLTS